VGNEQMLINVSTRVKAAKPRPIDFDLAAVEADVGLRFPPAVPLPVTTSRMAWTTDLSSVIHHLAEGLHPGKTTRSSPKYSTGLKLHRSRRNRSKCSKLVHGIALSDHMKPVPVAPPVGHVDGVVS
jgi:hypothetical protein